VSELPPVAIAGGAPSVPFGIAQGTELRVDAECAVCFRSRGVDERPSHDDGAHWAGGTEFHRPLNRGRDLLSRDRDEREPREIVLGCGREEIDRGGAERSGQCDRRLGQPSSNPAAPRLRCDGDRP
jgi:hypothetical protein